MQDDTRAYLDVQFAALGTRMGALEVRVQELDDSINKTVDENKPSLRNQVIFLKKELAQIQSIMGKVFTLLGATPITVLIGYAMLHIFGSSGGQK